MGRYVSLGHETTVKSLPTHGNRHDTRSDLASTGLLGTHPTRACARFPVHTAERSAAPRESRDWVGSLNPQLGHGAPQLVYYTPHILVEVVDGSHGYQPVPTHLGQPDYSGPYSAGSVDHRIWFRVIRSDQIDFSRSLDTCGRSVKSDM